MRSSRLSKLLDAGLPGRVDRLWRCESASIRRSFRQTLLKRAWAVFALFALVVGLVHATATYVYDANGRLRAVTNSTGASAAYVYDAMGNLVQVQSVPATQLAIFAFTPDHGAVGTTVTIAGQGFSTTIANDTVEFNGTAAVVMSATATTLTTSVPVGATTGAITVTVGTSTATSSDAFTVDTTGQPPVVTSFSPSIGASGTVVTVLGENLDPVSNQSYPAIDGTKGTPTSASQTQVVFPVSSVMASGKVSVTTPFGMGVSSADFFITPPGISAANVAVTTRVAVGASVPLSLPVGKYGAVLFDANAGSWLSFQASSLVNSSNAIGYTIYDSHNHPMLSGTLTTSNASIHLAVIPVTGTYSIWLTSPSAANLTLALQADPTLSLNAALAVTTTGTGQTQRLFFNANAQATLGLQLASQVTSPASANVQYAITAPNGANVTSFTTATATFINLPSLPMTGVYTVMVTPTTPATTTSQLELVNGVTGSVSINGAPLNVTTQWGGQTAYLTFAATAGENVGLALTNANESPDQALSFRVYSPSGAYVTTVSCLGTNASCSVDLQNLAAGAYQVQVVPYSSSGTMSFTVTATDDVVGTLPLNTTETVALSRPGQTGTYTFNATAGQTLALVAGAAAIVPSGSNYYYRLYAPDGSVYGSYFKSGSFTWNLPSLSQSGTYTLYVESSAGATLSQTLELASGVVGTVTVNGAAANFATTVPGEYVYLTFTVTAGENVGLALTGMNETPDQFASFYVYNPSGVSVSSANCIGTNAGCSVDLQSLAAGTYQIQVVPQSSGGTMSFTVTATDDVMETLPLNTAETVALSRPGQTGTYTFSATAGQTLALMTGAATIAPSGSYFYYYLYAPDGSLYGSNSTTGSGFTRNLPSLTQSGTYKLYVKSTVGATLNQTLELASGVTGTVSVNGAATNFSTMVPGENVYLTFTASAGENVGLALTNVNEVPDHSATFHVYDPNGVSVTGASCIGTNVGCSVDLQNLVAGTYQVQVIPASSSGTMSFTVTTTDDVVGTLPLNTAETVALSQPGQTGTYTFNATAGQTLALMVGAATIAPSGSYFYYYLYAPDGSLYANNSTSGSNFTWNLSSLSQSGTYKLYVKSTVGATLSQTVELASGVTGTVTVNGAAANFATTVPGEKVYLTFTAAAGENVGLALTNANGSPDPSVGLKVYNSSGGSVAGATCLGANAGCAVDLQNLAAGTYQIQVSPETSSDTTSFTVTATDDVVGTLPLNTAETVALSRPGQTGTYTFSATAGQTVALVAGAVTIVPSNSYYNYYLYAPDGTQYGTNSMTGSNFTWNLPNLSQSGTYTLYLKSTIGATLSQTLELASGVTGTVVVNGGAANFATTASGENVYLTFAATAGENVGLALTNVNESPDNDVSFHVYSPSGASVTYGSCAGANASCSANLQNLVAGTYQIQVLPESSRGTTSFTVALNQQ